MTSGSAISNRRARPTSARWCTPSPALPVLHLAVTFRFTDIEPDRGKLGMDVRLPLGITVREDMTVSPIDASRCRVSYSCDFGFPKGPRGALVRALIGRELTAGPAESLARLKAAAERAPQLS